LGEIEAQILNDSHFSGETTSFAMLGEGNFLRFRGDRNFWTWKIVWPFRVKFIYLEKKKGEKWKMRWGIYKF